MRIPLSTKIKNQVLKRDNHRCQKCWRQNGFRTHHIKAPYLGGEDEPENLITLCACCHDEWHSLDAGSSISFDEWMELPTFLELIAFYKSLLIQSQNTELTLPDVLDAFQVMQELRRGD